MPQFYYDYEYIPISSEFIETHMPKANATFVKVYLYALNFAAKGRNIEYSEIAQELNLLESDVLQAFNYWQEIGIIQTDGDTVSFCKSKTNSFAEQKNQENAQTPKEHNTRPGYAPGDVAQAISGNPVLSETISLAEEILGKTLSPVDTETLYWFFDGLKFSPEVILMLLEYCVSKEKRRMSYIEKVALSWHERGITSMEAVNDYIQKESERSGFIYSIRKLLGITDRAISQSEEQYINRWRDMYKMDEDMISLAYEQCIIQTAKLSFPYMEKILERWHKQGIHTPSQAENDKKNFKNNRNGTTNSKSDFGIYSEDYDHDSLEQLTRKKQ